MIARGFRPVAWVGAIAAAALCCYMLSLKVAAERAELTTLERRIVSARQDIRTLQTELGTRGRLQQLEQWNADVLALSAPVAGQFIARDVSLARFDVRTPAFQPSDEVRLASAPPAPTAPPPMAVAPRQASLAQAPARQAESALQPAVRRTSLVQTVSAAQPAPPERPLVRRASLDTGESTAPARVRTAARPARAAPSAQRGDRLLDEGTLDDLGRAARAERRMARD